MYIKIKFLILIINVFIVFELMSSPDGKAFGNIPYIPLMKRRETVVRTLIKDKNKKMIGIEFPLLSNKFFIIITYCIAILTQEKNKMSTCID